MAFKRKPGGFPCRLGNQRAANEPIVPVPSEPGVPLAGAPHGTRKGTPYSLFKGLRGDTNPNVWAVAGITESADVVAGIGTTLVGGSAAITEGSEAVAATGTVSVSGISSITESADALAGVGTPSVSGTAALAETTDTVSGAGSDASGGILGLTESADASDGSGTAVPSAAFSGGYETAYERHLLHRRREREREVEIAREAQQVAKADPIQAELARYLHEQLQKQSKHDDLLRMQKIVASQKLDRTLPDKVQKAFELAQAEASFSRLLALEREFIKMQEEEELAVLLTLSLL